MRAATDGVLDYDELEQLVTPGTRAVVVTHASNVTGNEVDIARVAAMAHAAGALVIVDASQSAGTAHIDMQAMGLDVVCFTGHKGLMGPQGTGGLAVAEGIDVAPWAMGGTGVHSFDALQPLEWPTRLEAGTLNGHGIAGLLAAVEFIRETGMDAIRTHELALARRFYEGVRDVDGVHVYGDFSSSMRAPVVALNIRNEESSIIADALAEDYAIAVRAGAHCAPRMHKALGTVEQGAVRFSFGYYNTEEETDAAIAAVRELAEQ